MLEKIAGLNTEEADKTMMQAHLKGASLVAILPKGDAEALVEKMLRADVLAECRPASDLPKSN